MNPTKVSICDIVLYHNPGSADGKHPRTDSPAIVQEVDANGLCTLFVFGPTSQHIVPRATEGTGPQQWSWRPEQVRADMTDQQIHDKQVRDQQILDQDQAEVDRAAERDRQDRVQNPDPRPPSRRV